MWPIIIILAVVAVAYAAQSDGAPPGAVLSADEGCTAITVNDAAEFARRAVTFGQANGWSAKAQDLAEVRDRVLAFIRTELPQCVGKVPELIDGVSFDDVIAEAWSHVPDAGPALEGSAPAPDRWWAPLALGVIAAPEGVVGSPQPKGPAIGNYFPQDQD